MTWFDIYNEFIKNFEKISQLQKDYIINLEKINYLYNESIKSVESNMQFDNMQRMNQKWFDLFSKSWDQQQTEKR